MTTNIIRYNYEFLQNFCKEYNIILLKDYSSEKINRDSIIEGKCKSENCNEHFKRRLRSLVDNNSYHCLECYSKLVDNKRKNTNLNKYGVTNVTKLKETQNKIINTNLEKYNCERPSQNKEIKDKIKKTNINKSNEEKQKIYSKRKNTNKQTRGIEFLDFSKEALYKLRNDFNIKLLDNNYNETDLNFYDNIYREGIIYFKCIVDNCNDINCKTFRQIKDKSGAYCEKHTQENMITKCKETNINNTGYDNPMKNQEIREKAISKLIETHNNPEKSKEIKNKTKNANLKNNGVEYPQQSYTIKLKTIKTNNRKFGVDYPAQNTEIMEKQSKNAYKLKDYTLPSGNILKIQGYENYALDDILKEGILEEEIINGCNNVPEIWYTDENNKKHRHYVDIFIPSQNRCIEVKSTWTAEKKKDCIFLKQQAGKELGYNYEIWVYDGKGEKVECYK